MADSSTFLILKIFSFWRNLKEIYGCNAMSQQPTDF